ncbi:MAG: class I SAM-dependent methyltransferase [Chlamydiae bacterium]|nr:class I SAM-dependent methyltransferase [Chlamydiota bacterium]
MMVSAMSAEFGKDDLPYPYNEVQPVLPFNNHGWYNNRSYIEKLVEEVNPTIVVEVGSWIGLSTRHIASILKQPNAKLYAVDHWLGSAEHQIGQFAYMPFLDKLYEQFLSNIIRANLTHIVVPMRMSSLDAVKIFPATPDLIYIDAGHDYESVYKDLLAWYPLVRGHGVLCGDDWWWDSVRKAVEDFARDNSLKIFAENNFWRLIE